MRKILLAALSAAVSLVSIHAQTLKFSDKGEFKIVQFTDLHYQWGNEASAPAIDCMNAVLDAECPDLVVITGDMVYSDNVEKIIPVLFAPIVDRGLPFITVFGNHDEQFDRTLAEIYDLIAAVPGNLQPARGDAFSPDYAVEILCSGGKKPAEVLYCIDTHSLSDVEGAGLYDWITHDQISWYRNVSRKYTSGNDGSPLPSVAFFHIPIPEYVQAVADDASAVVGLRAEAECCPSVNSGFFCSVKEMGDIYAMFCGHDHDNDYVVPFRGVLLGYGRFSGGNTEYHHYDPNGGRVIVLHEGKKSLDTWLRLADGSVKDVYKFPCL